MLMQLTPPLPSLIPMLTTPVDQGVFIIRAMLDNHWKAI